jgi:5-methylcytosine-specific restriction enzyme subunit McrC
MDSPRLIHLTERVPRIVRLHRADVDFLLDEHRGRFEVVPAGTGRYRLTALGVAGVLAMPRSRLAIRPKLTAANLWHLLDPLHPPPVSCSPSQPADAVRLPDLFTARFATLLTERIAAGLHRDYVERAEVSPILRGKLDVAEQIRDTTARRDRLHGRFDEFTADIPCNRLPRAVAEALLNHPCVGDEARGPLAAALGAFGEVRAEPLTNELCQVAAPDERRCAGYGPLLALCRLIAGGMTSSGIAGPNAGPAFLLDLEAAWERYVMFALSHAVCGSGSHALVVCAQPYLSASPPATGQPELHVRPDILVVSGEQRKPRMVIDAKWKRLSPAALPTDDVYQVLAYAAALGVPRAVLVYPASHNRCWTYPTAGPRLDVITLRITGSLERCESARRRFGRWLVREA